MQPFSSCQRSVRGNGANRRPGTHCKLICVENIKEIMRREREGPYMLSILAQTLCARLFMQVHSSNRWAANMDLKGQTLCGVFARQLLLATGGSLIYKLWIFSNFFKVFLNEILFSSGCFLFPFVDDRVPEPDFKARARLLMRCRCFFLKMSPSSPWTSPAPVGVANWTYGFPECSSFMIFMDLFDSFASSFLIVSTCFGWVAEIASHSLVFWKKDEFWWWVLHEMLRCFEVRWRVHLSWLPWGPRFISPKKTCSQICGLPLTQFSFAFHTISPLRPKIGKRFQRSRIFGHAWSTFGSCLSANLFFTQFDNNFAMFTDHCWRLKARGWHCVSSCQVKSVHNRILE